MAGSGAGSVAGSGAANSTLVAGSGAGSGAGSVAGSGSPSSTFVAGSGAGSVAGSVADSVAGMGRADSVAGSVAGKAAGSGAGSVAGSVAGSWAAVEEVDLAKLSLDDEMGEPKWPRVRCSTKGCSHVDRWSRMISTKEIVHFQETFLDAPDQVRYTHKCVVCVMRDEGVEKPAALAFIYERNGTWQYKKGRVDRFEVQMLQTVEHLEALGDGGGEQGDGRRVRGRRVYQISLSFCTKVFSGLSEMIVLKAKQMRTIAVANKEAEKHFEELKTCADPARVRELIGIIEATVIIDIPQLSFGGSREHLNASAYDDEMGSFQGGTSDTSSCALATGQTAFRATSA